MHDSFHGLRTDTPHQFASNLKQQFIFLTQRRKGAE